MLLLSKLLIAVVAACFAAAVASPAIAGTGDRHSSTQVSNLTVLALLWLLLRLIFLYIPTALKSPVSVPGNN